jgi:hypothetical protein
VILLTKTTNATQTSIEKSTMEPTAISETATLTLMYELMQFARRKLTEPALKEEIQRQCGGSDLPELLSGISRASEVLFPAMIIDFLPENTETAKCQRARILGLATEAPSGAHMAQ